MAVSTLTRNLRDGQLVVNDGAGSPKTVTLTLDEGDLSWTETLETREISDRGALDHTRPGNEVPCDMSFSIKWNQLISYTANSSDGNVLYEMVNNIGGGYTSTSGTGQQFTLEYVFTCTSPTAAGTETVTFAKVFKTSMDMSEQEDYNTISFSGRDFETRPTVARV